MLTSYDDFDCNIKDTPNIQWYYFLVCIVTLTIKSFSYSVFFLGNSYYLHVDFPYFIIHTCHFSISFSSSVIFIHICYFIIFLSILIQLILLYPASNKNLTCSLTKIIVISSYSCDALFYLPKNTRCPKILYPVYWIYF